MSDSINTSESGNNGNSVNNVATVSDGKSGFEIIRLGFTIVGSLAGTALILSAVNGFRAIDPTVLAMIGSTITGIFAFLAGRKK